MSQEFEYSEESLRYLKGRRMFLQAMAVSFLLGIAMVVCLRLYHGSSSEPKSLTLAEIETQHQIDRLTYTAGTPRWYLATSLTDQTAYFANVCQNELGLQPETHLFNHCLKSERNFLEQKIQLQKPEKEIQP